MNGYARVISAEDGSCEVGFWRDDVPWGKYCKYNTYGEEELCEGLYEGHGEAGRRTKIVIANYESQISRT